MTTEHVELYKQAAALPGNIKRILESLAQIEKWIETFWNSSLQPHVFEIASRNEPGKRLIPNMLITLNVSHDINKGILTNI